jgi:hypothetical protein
MDGDASVFKDKCLQGSTSSSVWCIDGHCEFWMVSAGGDTVFELGKTTRELVFFTISALQKPFQKFQTFL